MKQLKRMLIGALAGNVCLTVCIVAFHAIIARDLFNDGQYTLIPMFAGFVGGILGAGAYPVYASRTEGGRYEAILCILCSLLGMALIGELIEMVSSNATTVGGNAGQAAVGYVWFLAPIEVAALGALGYGVQGCLKKSVPAGSASSDISDG